MKKYDIIIIGGGLAGCTLGYLLRKQNKKVLVVEKQKLKNKDKLCGGLLTEKSYKLLEEIYGDFEKNLKIKKYEEAYIKNKDKKIKISNISLYSVYRKDIDDFVLNRYLSLKGDIIENTTYDSLNTKNKTVKINGMTYKYQNLVGADGVFSQLRKEVSKKQQRINFALETKLNNPKLENIEVHFFDKQKSYGWIIPNFSNSLVGIGNVDGKAKIEKDFKNYYNKLNLNIKNKRGAFLPTGDDILLETSNNIYFIGDSAGLISPITGEGIYYALFSAQKLSNNLNGLYIKEMKEIVKIIKKENSYKKYVYNFRIRNFLFNRHERKLYKKIIERFTNFIL